MPRPRRRRPLSSTVRRVATTSSARRKPESRAHRPTRRRSRSPPAPCRLAPIFAGANQTTCSTSAGGTTTTSGSGTTEEYVLICNIAYTPPAGYNTAAPVQFTAVPGPFSGSTLGNTTSATLNISFASPGTPTCIDPASAGSTTTFDEGTTAFYTVECEESTGVSGAVSYPKQISIASGAFVGSTPFFPGGGSTGTEPGAPGTGTGTNSTSACGTTTSGYRRHRRGHPRM